MILSHSKKFIFIHNYRTAGTSISKHLSKYGIKDPLISNNSFNLILEHCPYGNLINKYLISNKIFNKTNSHWPAEKIKNNIDDNIWQNYFKFGFVRNPWSLQVSVYYYIKQHPNHYEHQRVMKLKNFKGFVKWRFISSCKSKPPLYLDVLYQKDFFYDKNGNCLVDYIGRYENLEKDYKYICDKIKIKNKLPHINKSHHFDYHKYYDNQTKQQIAKVYKKDIELFKYEF